MRQMPVVLTLLATLAACSEKAAPKVDSSLATAAVPASTVPAVATPGTVRTATDATNGTYLTDADGRALYLFEKDKSGQSLCEAECAAAWPPFVASAPTSGDAQVQAAMLSTITRKDGTQQVTYNGMPLYYYAKDTAAGQTTGQDIEEFGEEWYLVAPNGKKQSGTH